MKYRSIWNSFCTYLVGYMGKLAYFWDFKAFLSVFTPWNGANFRNMEFYRLISTKFNYKACSWENKKVVNSISGLQMIFQYKIYFADKITFLEYFIIRWVQYLFIAPIRENDSTR